MLKLKPLSDQVVVIVGASSGIGRRTAVDMARRGARLVVAARGEPGLRSLVEEIHEEGGQAVYQVADVTNPEDMHALVRRAMEEYGGLDTWVHVAAVSLWARVEETTPEEYRQILHVNLLGAIHGALAAGPALAGRGGAFIAVSSIEGRRALPLQGAYAASKHGLIGFLDAWRTELRAERAPVSVTNVMPSTIDTPLFERAGTKIGVQPQGLPPVYRPEHVAAAILHAAEHPTRDIVVGGGGRLIMTAQTLFPAAVDLALAAFGVRGQYTHIPKSAAAATNLYTSLPGYDRELGNLKGRAVSVYTWLRTHPPALTLLTLGTALVILNRMKGRA